VPHHNISEVGRMKPALNQSFYIVSAWSWPAGLQAALVNLQLMVSSASSGSTRGVYDRVLL
jgi:hypothetical protein